MHVAFLTSARSWRGSASVFAAVAQGAQEGGHAVLGLVAHAALEREFGARGVPAQTLPVRHTSPRAAWALRRALQETVATHLVVDKARDVRNGALATLGRGIPIVYSVSTPVPSVEPHTRLAFRAVRRTVFLTDGLARAALARAPFMRRAPWSVIPNGVDCEVFRPDPEAARAFRARWRVSEAAPLLIGVGALEVEKRWDLLLEALARMPGPQPPLILCGTGSREAALREQAGRLRLDVRFAGQLPTEALVGAYSAATVVVHTRPDEVFSLALLEALACGAPIVAANGGGTAELIGEAGVLVAPGDGAAFARALGALLENGDRRVALGSAARERALERYSQARMVQDYLALLQSLAETP